MENYYAHIALKSSNNPEHPLVVEVNEKPMPGRPMWSPISDIEEMNEDIYDDAIKAWQSTLRTIPVAKEEKHKFYQLVSEKGNYIGIHQRLLEDDLKTGIMLPPGCIEIKQNCHKPHCMCVAGCAGKEFAYLKKEEEHNCPACGAKVKVAGGPTTHYYVPVEESQEDLWEDLLEMLLAVEWDEVTTMKDVKSKFKISRI